jgi:hypothetical protein
MGFTPQQVNEMSIWQFMAAVEGYAKHHSPDGDKQLTSKEKDELWDWIEA